MELPTSTPSQVHAELVASARRIIADHWPRGDHGPCPVCKVPDCEALKGALHYLKTFADPTVLTVPDTNADLLAIMSSLKPSVATRLARRIHMAHQPGQTCCLICQTPECRPYSIATGWLIAVDDPWLAERRPD